MKSTPAPLPGFQHLRLDTPRLHLRPLAEHDEDALFALFSDPRVMRYWSTPPWTQRAKARAMVDRDREAMASGEHLRLGIVRTSDERLVGTCTLFQLVPGCRRAEVGYALVPAAWGQGLLQEALGALLDHGFGAMDLNRVEADIDPRNTASARSLERLGFRHEGLLRERWIVDGEVSDSALYGLLQRDWLARRAGA